jgi:hypothetical protein
MSYPDAHYLGDKGEISAIYRPADASISPLIIR